MSILDKYKKELLEKQQIYLRMKALPNAGQTKIKQILSDQTIKIDLAAPAVKGRANLELIKFLAREFAINKNHVKIIGGAADRVKLVKIVK